MPKKNTDMSPETEKNDILERLDAEVNPEKEMSDPEEKAGVKEDEKKNAAAEARAARRDLRRRQVEASNEREQRLAQEQIDLTTESSLRSAIRTGTVFYGTAASVETITNEDGEQEATLVVLLKLNFKVVIPFRELYTYNPIDMSTVDLTTDAGKFDYVRRKRMFADRMIGSTICFCLLDFYPDGNTVTAFGSRAAAMKKISQRMFGGSHPRIKEGDIGDAIVTAVSRHAIAVEFNGVDVVIPQYRLTLRWMRYVHEFYKIGDSIKVKVRQIKKNSDGDVVSLGLDHIACELADARDRYALISNGARLRGIVTNVYRPAGSRHIYIYAWLPEWEIPAKIARISANDFGKEIKAGTQMLLQVVSHDDNGYVNCIALSEHGNSGMFAHGRPVTMR